MRDEAVDLFIFSPGEHSIYLKLKGRSLPDFPTTIATAEKTSTAVA